MERFFLKKRVNTNSIISFHLVSLHNKRQSNSDLIHLKQTRLAIKILQSIPIDRK